MSQLGTLMTREEIVGLSTLVILILIICFALYLAHRTSELVDLVTEATPTAVLSPTITPEWAKLNTTDRARITIEQLPFGGRVRNLCVQAYGYTIGPPDEPLSQEDFVEGDEMAIKIIPLEPKCESGDG